MNRFFLVLLTSGTVLIIERQMTIGEHTWHAFETQLHFERFRTYADAAVAKQVPITVFALLQVLAGTVQGCRW